MIKVSVAFGMLSRGDEFAVFTTLGAAPIAVHEEMTRSSVTWRILQITVTSQTHVELEESETEPANIVSLEDVSAPFFSRDTSLVESWTATVE